MCCLSIPKNHKSTLYKTVQKVWPITKYLNLVGVWNETWSEVGLTTCRKWKIFLKNTDNRFRKPKRNNGVMSVRRKLFTGVVGTQLTAAKIVNRPIGRGSIKEIVKETVSDKSFPDSIHSAKNGQIEICFKRFFQFWSF